MSLRIKTQLVAWKHHLLTFSVNQLCITLISWPLLLWWGLPVALLSPLGNLIFTPFLTLFLVLSLLVTSTQLCLIPNGLLITSLDGLVQSWLYLTAQAPSNWILTFVKPPLLIGLIPSIAAIAIMHFRGFKKTVYKLLALILVALLFPLLLLLAPHRERLELPLGSKKLTVTYQNKKVVTTLPSMVQPPKNSEQWIDYTLRPELACNFGRQELDCCSCKRLTPELCALIKALCKKGCVRELILPHTPLSLAKEIERYATATGVTVIYAPSSPSWAQASPQRTPRHRSRYIQGANESSKHLFHDLQ